MDKAMQDLLDRLWQFRIQVLEHQYNDQSRGRHLNLFLGHEEYDTFQALAYSYQGSEVMTVNGTDIPSQKYSVFGHIVHAVIVDEHNFLSWSYDYPL